LDYPPATIYQLVEKGRLAGEENHSYESGEHRANHCDQCATQCATLVVVQQQEISALLLR
jgi:hypothetical protein